MADDLREKVAHSLCTVQDSIEHMEQTDDEPCTRCLAWADAVLAAVDSERVDSSLVATIREHHRVEVAMGRPGSPATLLGHVGDLLDAYDAAVREAAALRAQLEQWQGIAEADRVRAVTLADANAKLRDQLIDAREQVAQVHAVVTDWGAGTVHRPRAAAYTRLRAILYPEES